MKKGLSAFLLLIFMSLSIPMQGKDIGVPSECEDVMLQAFYWDSYTLTKYGRTQWADLLKDTAAINANFDLVWLPPCANSTGGVGYIHACLSDQDASAWGNRAALSNLIAALHKGNTKVLADIVINHRGNKNSWCDFYEDNFGQYGSWQLTQEHICSNDEGFTDSSSSCYGSATHGAADTGTNFGGARDLDHTNSYVQKWSKAYLKYMLKSLKFDGFRYDMTLGYNGEYLGMYNESSKPYFSVSECWEGIERQKQHLQECDSNTMVFDFQQKYELASAIVGGSYGKLKKNSNSFRGQGLEKYAVTFIDNHDTFERSDAQTQEFGGYNADLSSTKVRGQILQANAYILLMPGVPCVFWPHWKSYQSEINALIAVRKLAGINSESIVSDEVTAQYSYSATIQGHRGKVILRLGSNHDRSTPNGYYRAIDGGMYTVFVENGAGLIEVPGNEEQANQGEKFIRDGKLYIRHGEKIFDAMGRVCDL
ncbi:MAG: hypothetical protein II928_00055 [Paludibacteraceae bacterium]|nr:hypothetical protein [Paludibacteraceae bacterium]